jgi:hypothetical protein
MRDPFDPTPPAVTAPGEVSTDAAPPVVLETDDTPVSPEAAEPSRERATDVDDDEVWEADEVLANATDQARSALEQMTPAATIGEPLGYIVEGEHVLSLLFDCLMDGYPGWRWTVSLSRVDGESEPQILETELTPGDDALLAPEWVPWSDRLADAKEAEELVAAELGDEDFDDDDDPDDDDADDDDTDTDVTDESAEAEDGDDDGVDVLDGIDFDEALTAAQQSAAVGSPASQQDEAQAGHTQPEADDGAPQPPVQARGMQFSSEENGTHRDE